MLLGDLIPGDLLRYVRHDQYTDKIIDKIVLIVSVEQAGRNVYLTFFYGDKLYKKLNAGFITDPIKRMNFYTI